jgi:N-acetylglucosaminyl-diphospho-decaprenol L-rhamnosyltransferase
VDGSEAALDVLDRALVTKDPDVPAKRDSESSNQSAVGISLILVTHNSGDVLTDLLGALADAPPSRSWELVVEDNASNDDSVEQVRAAFSNASISESDRNRGFAAAVNASATNAHGQYYLVVNPDIHWASGAIDTLASFLDEHPHAAAVAPRLVFPDGRPQFSVRHFPTHGNICFSRGAPWSRWFPRLTGSARYTVPDPETPQRIEAVAAACLLIRATAFEQIGGMDEGYFLFVEDTDFCRRLHEAGWEVWMDPTVQVVHRWGSLHANDPVRRRHHRRGIRRYFRKFHPRKRVRNAILFTLLGLADAASRLFGSRRARGAAK